MAANTPVRQRLIGVIKRFVRWFLLGLLSYFGILLLGLIPVNNGFHPANTEFRFTLFQMRSTQILLFQKRLQSLIGLMSLALRESLRTSEITRTLPLVGAIENSFLKPSLGTTSNYRLQPTHCCFHRVAASMLLLFSQTVIEMRLP